MLRLFAAGLLLANLLFFGWAQGWFAPAWPAPRSAEHEPERLAAQVHADRITVLQPRRSAAAAPAAAEPPACLETGPMLPADLAVAEAMLSSVLPADGWVREPAPPAPRWLVFSPLATDPAIQRAREAELQREGITFEAVGAQADLGPGLVFARVGTREAAEAALRQLIGPNGPPRGARVVALSATPPRTALRIPQADPTQQQRLRAINAAPLAGAFRACGARS